MDTQALAAVVAAELAAQADSEKAGPMAAYMKTDMAFYGVQKAGRTSIARMVKREYPPANATEYADAVLSLWSLEHREEKYLALAYARSFDEFTTTDAMGLYEFLIVDGAWWDFVDEIASQLVGCVLLEERAGAEPTIRSWIGAENMWLRRTSIISQLKHKSATDTALLDDACTANLDDPEFFIRKAIGWSLREYAKSNPDWVRAYVAEHLDDLSALSRREATKHL